MNEEVIVKKFEPPAILENVERIGWVATAPLSRLELVSPEGRFKSINLEGQLADWRNIYEVLERKGVNGVIYDVTFPIEFVNEARDTLQKEFRQYGIYGKAELLIYKREDRSNKYHLRTRARLSFDSYKEFLGRVQIQGINYNFTDIINAKGNSKYDIPVSEVRHSRKWQYERMSMINSGKLTIPEQKQWVSGRDYEGNTLNLSYTPMIYLNGADIVPGTPEHDIRTQEDGGAFFECAEDFEGTLSVDVRIKASFRGTVSGPFEGRNFKASATLRGKEETKIWNFRRVGNELRLDIDETHKVEVKKGEKISFYFEASADGQGREGDGRSFEITIYADDSEEFVLEYFAKSREKVFIDVVDPTVLMQRLIDTATDGQREYTVSIEWRKKDYNIFIAAADSIRGVKNAMVHTSINDFFNWLMTLGYEYEYRGDNVIFKVREAFFNPDKMAISLDASECSDLILQVDDEYLWTAIKIGYKEQTYNSVNGRFEVNRAFEYLTGYPSRSVKVRTWLVPYRADPIGIECLVWTRAERTKDTGSDNDVFFVALNNNFKEYMGVYAQAESGSELKMFNAVFNPKTIVERNATLFGITTKHLRLVSVDGSRDAVIPGQNLYSDIELPDRLIEPIEYVILTGTHQHLPTEDAESGYVKFLFHGKWYKGYIKQIQKNEITSETQTWKMWALPGE